jgi:hypothetical protein
LLNSFASKKVIWIKPIWIPPLLDFYKTIFTLFILNFNVMIPAKKFRNRVNRLKSIYTISLFALFPLINLQAQSIQPRLNQGALLEPQGKIINGAGQDLTAYNNYWNVMHALNKPLMYMTYVGLRDVTSDWADGLKADLMSHPGKFQIAQIGLSMTVDGTPSTHYEQDVAAGLYDKQIAMFIDGLQTLAMPAYVRIGYEFNGTAWNGYVPATYISSYIRITNMIRARGVEIATVWDFSMDGDMNYMDYYPGDEYVDWWGINIFSASHFTDGNAVNFVSSAQTHKKPVMIGETTPRNIGVLNGQQSWNQWFTPFFIFIHIHPEIKAFSYINWNWSQYPQWSSWGDARLEENAIVGTDFANELEWPDYLHASDENTFRKTLGSADNIAPATPGTISITQLGYPLQLNWNTVIDPSGLSHYIVYKNGVLSDYTLTLPYSDKNVSPGEVITYAVSAMDRAGNESPKTAGLQVTVPSSLNKVLNGEFDNGTQNWQLSSYAAGAVATMQIDSGSVISGNKSCAVTISQVSGTDWHIQLWQWLSVHQGQKYRITFKAKSSTTRNITLSVQQGASPYTVYFSKTHTLTNAVQTFTDEVSINTNDQAKIEFILGNSTGSVWIDAVSIMESSITTGLDEDAGKSGNLCLLQNYPSPFNLTTTIKYKVTEPGFVLLQVFDAIGTKVATLVSEKKAVGEYSTDWNAAGLRSGFYFCKLQFGKYNEVRKMLLKT